MARIASGEMKERLAVYFIMGSQNSERPTADVLKEALDGGVTLFQFREKGPGALKGADKEALARQLQRLCRAYGVPFIVNDDVELALAIDADGVHVGQDDEDARRVREKSAIKFWASQRTTSKKRWRPLRRAPITSASARFTRPVRKRMQRKRKDRMFSAACVKPASPFQSSPLAALPL
ncbi:Thiamine-phosphate synthase [Geobacillus sp. BCO2]|nr:Thiamine-phosphate synthase [Geobacillus sp. BCO2]